MDISVDNNILAVRLYQGESVIPSLKSAFESTGRRLGVILGGAGMMKHLKMGYFMGKGCYKEHRISEPMEIVSAAGNLISSADGFFAHIHVSLANDDFKVFGGHLEEAEVHGTGEFFILLSDIKATRKMEEETGLKGLKL